MHKELIISIVIIIAIFGANYITRNYTNYSIDTISESLNEIRENVMNEDENVDNEKVIELANVVQGKWEDVREKLACYLEHDELEKIETELTSILSYVEKEEYADVLASVDRGAYILKHLKEKEQLSLINIF